MRSPREDRVIREEYMEPVAAADYARYPYVRRDITRWGPVVAGVVASIAILVTLTVLGAGLQIVSFGPNANPFDLATGIGIWTAASTLIALFVGGYLTGWAAGVGGWLSGLVHGTLVWAVLLVVTLFFSGLGVGSLLGTALGQLGTTVNPSTVTPPTPAQTGSAMLWTFALLVIGWAVAAIGGMVGGIRETAVAEARTRVETVDRTGAIDRVDRVDYVDHGDHVDHVDHGPSDRMS